MKKIFILLIFLSISLFAKVEWGDMFDVYDEAKTSNKTVMVMLSRKGCPGCECMKTVVFENKEVEKLLKENFLCVELDVQEDFVPQNLEYFATPTFYFLDKNETILERLNGGLKAKDFIDILQVQKQ